MKIVFVAIGVESLAIELLSSYLKKQGHEVEVVFDPKLFDSEAVSSTFLAKLFDTKRQLIGEIISQKPDFVGFSVFTLNYQRALTLSKLLKKKAKSIPIIFGGIHPTSVPEVVIQEKSVDIVCVGEGEQALDELLSHPQRTNIRNLWFKHQNQIIKNPPRPLIDNLDSLPFPDKDLFNQIYPGFLDDYYTASSRGCPFNCTYCANSVLNDLYRGLGRPVRRRSPQNIIDELVLAKKKYSPQKITFVDDIFVEDVNWLKEFTKLYRQKIKLPYVVLTHPKFVTAKIAKLLANSGCYFLLFGIQSASENTRAKILHRFETNQEIRLAAKNCHRAKLAFSIDHIFNLPQEGLAEYEEALTFYNELRPSVINSFWLQYFPKAKIIDTAIKMGYLKTKDIRQINQGLTSSSVVVGFGKKNSFNPQLIYTNFQFYFMILPILPKKTINWMIKRQLYLSSFKPPLFINIAIKFFLNLFYGRGNVYLDMIKNMWHFSWYNLKLKVKYAKN